jgi:hypothetical protein
LLFQDQRRNFDFFVAFAPFAMCNVHIECEQAVSL